LCKEKQNPRQGLKTQSTHFKKLKNEVNLNIKSLGKCFEVEDASKTIDGLTKHTLLRKVIIRIYYRVF